MAKEKKLNAGIDRGGFNTMEQGRVNSDFNYSNKLRPFVTEVPTYVPKNHTEQVVYYLSGTDFRTYAYIDNEWRQVGSAPSFARGSFGRNTSDSTDKVITTGFEPKLITISAMIKDTNHAISIGSASSTSNQSTIWSKTGSSALIYSDRIVHVEGSSGALTGAISTISSTTFTIAWSAYAEGAYLVWEAQG